MREILFRGKCTDNGEWVEGYFANICGYFYIFTGKIVITNVRVDYEKYEVDPETVGQYTGLKDKNGLKIFEGDIFKFPDEVWESYYTSCGTEYNSWEVENYAVVSFDEDFARYGFVKYKYNENSVDAELYEDNELDFADFVNGLKIIGNIHDNPELLKEGGV